MKQQTNEKILLQKLAGIIKENHSTIEEEKAYYQDKEYFATPEFTERIIDAAIKEAKNRLLKFGKKGYVTQKEYGSIITPLYNTAYNEGEKYLRKRLKQG